MGLMTVVLSGSATSRPQAMACLKQSGFTVDDSDHSHGFEPGNGESFITAHGGSVDQAQAAVSHLQWSLRSHWEATGKWQKVAGLGQVTAPDPIEQIEQLKSQLRAAGINLGD